MWLLPEPIKGLVFTYHPGVHDGLSHELAHESELGTRLLHYTWLGIGTQWGGEQTCRAVDVLGRG